MKNQNPNKSGALRRVNRRTPLIPSLLLLAAALAWLPAQARAAVYSWNLFKNANISRNSTGDTIRVGGDGTFDPTTGAVTGTGAYTIRNAAGKTVSKGTWVAAAFVHFDAHGGLSNGLQGGVLDITVTLVSDSGAAVSDVPMEVLCPFADGVFQEENDGVKVGDFTTLLSGETVFHIEE